MNSKWDIKKAQSAAKNAGVKALVTCGLDLKGKSQEQAPIDLGDLRGDCSVSDPVDTSKGIQITVGYGLPYALRQHEEQEYEHPKGGKAKYLEDPYKENIDKYMKYIGNSIKKALGD